MTGLVDLIAPRNWLDAVWKGSVFMILINLLNYGLIVGLRGASFRLEEDLLNAVMVALPFVTFIMMALRHQYELQKKLTLLATTDALTGLPNRRAFLARTVAAIEAGQSGALLLLDADHFKRINDNWGHATGDLCLAHIAEHLRRNLRPGDLVGRIGGEEFSIYLPGAQAAQTHEISQRLCTAISITSSRIERELRVTLSIGAAFAAAGVSVDALMAQADSALYRAKAEGRARMVIWVEAADRLGRQDDIAPALLPPPGAGGGSIALHTGG